MKNIFLILSITFFCSCKAQTLILPLFNNPNYGDTHGAYYKDLNNDLNAFVGTWELVNGSTSLKIIIQKKLQNYSEMNNIYRDMLIGEYKYISNGIEKVNTLANITNSGNVYAHNIVGNIIIKNDNFPSCPECNLNEKRVSLMFDDPTITDVEGLDGEIIIRRVDIDGVQKIKVWLRPTGNITYIEGNPPTSTSFNVPWGEYILTKVN